MLLQNQNGRETEDWRGSIGSGEDTRRLAAAREALINDPETLKAIVEATVQRVLEWEMTERPRAGPHERTDSRRGHDNGCKPRTLKTRVGTLELRIPQDREGTFKTEVFERYQRSEKVLVVGLMDMYLEGVSTRKVTEVTEALCGTGFSKYTVSRLAGELDVDMTAWRDRRLDDVAYPYLVIDARYEHVRVGGQVVSQGVLIVKGVREAGHRELLAVDVADTESEATYDELFRRLKERGLQGVQLVTSDDHPGFVAAIDRHFQGAVWQRCYVPFLRSAGGKVARKHRKAPTHDLKAVYAAPDKAWPLELARDVVERCSETHPALARWIEDGIVGTLAHFSPPEAHRRNIQSTNGLERFNQEIKRRTRVVRIFPNREACLRLVTALCVEQSEGWLSGKRCLAVSHLEPAERRCTGAIPANENEEGDMAA